MNWRSLRTRSARFAAVVALALGLAVPATAGADGAIKQRQENQDDRIDQGADTGALTDQEQKALEKQQDAISQGRDKAIANDGKIGAGEARRLTHAQDKASGKIRRLKSNDRTAPPSE